MLSIFENDILYIGLSDNLYDRFQQHLDNKEKTNPTKDGKEIIDVSDLGNGFYFLRVFSLNRDEIVKTIKFEKTSWKE